jgi:hypothetical protein
MPVTAPKRPARDFATGAGTRPTLSRGASDLRLKVNEIAWQEFFGDSAFSLHPTGMGLVSPLYSPQENECSKANPRFFKERSI